MPEEATSDFSLPWCCALFDSPAWKVIPTLSRQRPKGDTENSLLADSLWNDRGVRAMQTFIKSNNRSPSDMEVLQLFSLGSGINGISGTCHGAIISLMLDEGAAQLATGLFGRYEIVTGALNVRFKRRLETPRVVLCRAWLEGPVQERKLTIKGTVEDGVGGVFATGETIFVRLKANL